MNDPRLTNGFRRRISLVVMLTLVATAGLVPAAAQAPPDPPPGPGGVFVTGADPDFHAHVGPNQAGARRVIQAAIGYVTHDATDPAVLLVTSIVNPGSGHSDPRLGMIAAGYTFDVADDGSAGGAVRDLATVDLDDYDVIVVGSDFGGWLRQGEVDALVGRTGELIDWINNGGGLVAFAQSGRLVTEDRFGFLPFLVSDVPLDQTEVGYQVTEFGQTLGLTDADINGNFSHNVFTASGGMDVVAVDAQGRLLTLATRGELDEGGVVDPDPDDPPPGHAPIADAGDDQTLEEGSVVSLDGTRSTDPNPTRIDPADVDATLPGGTSIGGSLDALTPDGGGGLTLTGRTRVGEGTQTPSTALVYVLDVSGSTLSGGGCGGDANGDGQSNTILDCEIAAARALNQQAIASGTVAEVGAVAFATNAIAGDLSPAEGVQVLVAPDADENDSGVPDVEEALASIFTRSSGGSVGFQTFSNRFVSNNSTSFAAGIQAACGLLANSNQPNRLVVFLSDGANNAGSNVSSVLPCDPPAVFHTFAAGPGVRCASTPSRGGLQTIANLTGGICTDVTDLSALPDLLSGVIQARLLRAELTIDGGDPIDVSAHLDPSPPVTGPVGAALSMPLPDLPGGTELCLTVHGEDAGGTGTATTCSVVRPDVPLRYEWQLVARQGPTIFLSSTTSPTPSFVAPDDGRYTFELTVTNGAGLTDTDRVTVVVDNADPVLTIEPGSSFAGGVTLLNGSFTDPGWLDVHDATIDWGDGSVDEVAVTAQGSGWGTFFGSHVYQDAGTYRVQVTLHDDDGGSDTRVVEEFHVADPVALWANREGGTKTLDWSGSSGTIAGRIHTNGELRFVGQTKTVQGPATYAGKLAADTDRHIFDPAPAEAPFEDFPVRFDVADYRPDGPVALQVDDAYHDMSAECDNGTWHQPQEVLAPGVYYADCSIQLNGSDIGGAVTLAAEGWIKLAGSRPAFEPFHGGVLAVSGWAGTNRAGVEIATSTSKFLGVLFAEHSAISVTGSDNRFFCGLLGDTIDLSGARVDIRAADCGQPADTVAGPLLVPDLTLGLAADTDEVLPADTIGYGLTVTNDGALLVAPGLFGLENVDGAPATVTGFDYTLEFFSVADGAWIPLASTIDGVGEVDLDPSVRANTADGVIYPDGDDDDPVVGTTIEPGGLATWGNQALVTLAADRVAALLDPAATAGLRNRVEFDLDPASVQVRRLYTFGTDFVEDLRDLSGQVTDVAVTFIPPEGDLVTFDGDTDAALVDLSPGATVALGSDFDVPVPAPRGDGESDDGYLARLTALDGTTLTGAAFALAGGGVGRLAAPLALASATEHVPAVALDSHGPQTLPAGTTGDYTFDLANRGSATATSLTLAAAADDDPLPLQGVPAALDGFELATATGSMVAPPDGSGEVAVTAQVDWHDASGNVYGPVRTSRATDVLAPAELVATLTGELAVDADGDGFTSPGDTVRYTLRIRNDGGQSLTGVTASVAPDPNSTLAVGTVDASQHATVDAGNGAGDTAVVVSWGSIAAGSVEVVTFDVTVHDPFPDGVTRLEVQGTVTADGFDPVLTDDPSRPGAADTTRTPVVVPEPAVVAFLKDRLYRDLDGNGLPSPGDWLRYTLTVQSVGSLAATGLTVAVPLPAGATLVDGTVTTDTGTAVGDGEVVVDLGALAPFANATVTFDVRIDDPLPSGVTQLTVQGTVTGEGIDPTPTGDPTTFETVDPTITVLHPKGGGPGDPGDGPGGGGTVQPGPDIGQVSLDEGAILTTPTPVSVTLSPRDDEPVTAWSIGYRHDGDSNVTELASSDTVDLALADLVSEGDVEAAAEIDPTLLTNGLYWLVVTAESPDGGRSRTETSFVVDGQLKLGRFEVLFEDLTVPVAGEAIGVQRRYDSFDRSDGDFGFGWSLDLADFRVSTNGPLGLGGWMAESCGPGLIFVPLCYSSTTPHFVTVTWPDGRNEIFDLTPAKGSTFLTGLTSAEFTGRPGTTSSLEALDTSLWMADGNLYGGLFGHQGLYDPARFRLTDKHGTVWLLDRHAGLVSVTDRNDERLQFSNAGITSSVSGPVLEYLRDAAGRITTIHGPGGLSVSYAYDDAGHLVAATDPNGNTTTFDYDDDRRLVGIDGPDSQPLSVLVYGDDGRLQSVTDAAGNTTEITIDIDDRTEVVTSPDGRLTTVASFDERGNLIRLDEVSDSQTFTTRYEYDPFDRPTREIDPAGNTSTFEWSQAGDLTSLTDAEGRRTTIAYSTLGLPTRVVDAAGDTEVELDYDDRGNLTRQVRADGSELTFAYDTAGRVTSATGPGGQSVSLTYDETGNLTRMTDAFGDNASYTYDASGRVTSVSDATGRTVAFGYDAVGNVVRVTDPLGRSETYTYDAFDRVVTITDALEQVTSFDYDEVGNLIEVTDRNGDRTTYTYDRMGRATSRSAPGVGPTSYDYDGLGRLVSLSNSDGAIEFAYDTAGDLIRQTTSSPGQPTVELGFAYDRSGLPITTTGPGGAQSYAYDPTGRLRSASRNDAGTIRFSYDELGRVVGVERPNGVVDTLDWSEFDTLVQREARRDGDVVSRVEYDLDDRGRRTAMHDLDGVHTFQHDTADRLATVVRPAASGLPNESYAYDALGNRTSWSGSPAATVAYDANNRLLSDGTYDYAYDGEGRLISRLERVSGQLTTYEWDADGQLRRIDAAGEVTTFRYDPLGRRVEVGAGGEVTRYVYDGWNPIYEFGSDGQLRASHLTAADAGTVLASNLDGDVVYPVVDTQGSTVGLTDASGALTERLRYGAFGQPGGSSDYTTYSFTGHQYDTNTGLYYARARYYDPAIGRFLSEDPLAAVNLYPYAHNDPVHLVDPTGAAAAVEYRILSTVKVALARALAQEGGIFICRTLVNVAIAGLTGGAGAGSPALGAAAERALSRYTGLPRNQNPRTSFPTGSGTSRIPDFVNGNTAGESKFVNRLSDSRQLRQTQVLANQSGRTYVVFTTASEARRLAESGRSGLVQRAVGQGRALRGAGLPGGSGLAIIGCLPG